MKMDERLLTFVIA